MFDQGREEGGDGLLYALQVGGLGRLVHIDKLMRSGDLDVAQAVQEQAAEAG